MKRIIGAPAVLLGATALVLSGCGDGTSTVTVDRTVTQTTPTTSTTQTATSTGADTNTGTTPSEPPTRFVRREAFLSPTGNIGCMLIGGVARCDIVKRRWSLPPRPSSCPEDVDFGQGLQVERSGRARFVCAGDTARDPSASKLPYGTASQVGPFICVSRSTGVTCTNRFNGHGFFISIQSYRVF